MFIKADYPLCFINRRSKECRDEGFINSPSLSEITKPFISIEIPYCKLNEIKSKHFINLLTMVSELQ